MNKRLLAVGVTVLIGTASYADEVPATVTLSAEQAQARQFGIFVGGTASQYDLCVKKGYLPKGGQSAEEIAGAIFEKMRAANRGADQSAYVQEGWNMMRKEISQNESFFTQEKCTAAAKEWAKILVTMRQK
jgi:hypothetical protein